MAKSINYDEELKRRKGAGTAIKKSYNDEEISRRKSAAWTHDHRTNLANARKGKKSAPSPVSESLDNRRAQNRQKAVERRLNQKKASSNKSNKKETSSKSRSEPSRKSPVRVGANPISIGTFGGRDAPMSRAVELPNINIPGGILNPGLEGLQERGEERFDNRREAIRRFLRLLSDSARMEY